MRAQLQLLLVIGITVNHNICCINGEDDETGEESFMKVYRSNLQQMTKIMDTTLPPCDDFFTHACGNFHNYMDSSEAADEANAGVPPYLYNKQDRLEFFEEQKPYFGSAVGKTLQVLYDDCEQRDQRGSNLALPLQRWHNMLQQIDFLTTNATFYRQWPYLHYQWNQFKQRGLQLPSWIRLAAKMAAHGLPTLMHIYFAKDTIYIEPVSQIKCPGKADFISSLLSIQRRRNAQKANVIGNELWHFCREMQDVLIQSATEHVTEQDDESAALIDDLKNEYFQIFFTSLNLTLSEVHKARKIPLQMVHVNKLLRLFLIAEDRKVMNYLLWFFYTEVNQIDCYQLTDEFELLLNAEYWQWHAFDVVISRDVAMATYLYHTTRFQKQRKQMLMSEHWYKFLFVQLQKRDFNLERVMQQYANTYWNVSQLTAYFNATQLHSRAFYANLLTLRRQKIRYSFYTPYVDADDVNHPVYYLRKFFDFCISFLKQPLYHYYASQAYDLWDTSNILYDTDGYYTALDCLSKQSMLNFGLSKYYKVLTNTEVEEVFRFYRSFNEVFRDYHFWLEGESFYFAEDFILENFDLSSARIMFYAVAQLYCGRNDQLYALKINRAFMNMPAYHQAFNCSATTTMNPIAKCLMSNGDQI